MKTIPNGLWASLEKHSLPPCKTAFENSYFATIISFGDFIGILILFSIEKLKALLGQVFLLI